MVITVVCGEWTFLFSLLCLMKNSVWLFPCETLETALVGWVRENNSWYCCCGHKLNPLASQRIFCVAIDYYMPSRMGILIFFFSDAFETIAYANNSGVCVLLSKIPFFLLHQFCLDLACLAFTFPSGYVQRCYINALNLTEWRFWQPNAIVPKVWPLSL